MTTLTATAVITAVDRASAVFARVGANARALQGRVTAAAGGVHALRGAAAASLGIPAVLSVANFGHNEKEWDRVAHQYQAITEIGEQQFETLKKKIVEISNATGVSRMELLEAAKGWAELGNAPQTFIENAEVAARTSRITGVSVAEQMKESSALMRAFKGSDWKPADFKHFEEVYLVASKGMKGGAHAFGEAMKAWAPVSAGLGMTIEESSAFAQTLGGQFEPSEIGNALKTGFLRLAAPTPKANAAMRYAGINDARLYNLDKSRLSGHSLAEGLRGAGFNVSKDLEAQIGADIDTVDLSKGSAALVDKLRNTLSQAFGRATKTGKHILSAQDSAIVNQALLQLVGNAKGKLNWDEFFKQFGPFASNLALMSTVFGKEHAAKWMDLLKQAKHYTENYERIMEHSAGALERKSKIFFEGFSFELERLQANWQNLLGTVGGSGIKRDLSAMAQGLNDFFESAQHADPEKLRKIFWAVSALATAPVFGVGAAGVAALALAFTDLTKAFDGELKLELGPNGEVLNSYGPSQIVQTLESVKKLFSEIGAGLAPLGNAVREFFDISPDDSGFLGALKKADEWIKNITGYVKWSNQENGIKNAELAHPELAAINQPDWWVRMKLGEKWTSKHRTLNLPEGSYRIPSLLDQWPGMTEEPLPRFAPRSFSDVPPPVDRMSYGAGLARMGPPQQVNVHGAFEGVIKSEIKVEVIGGGRVVEQSTGGAAVSGRLDPGHSEMDLQGP